MAKTNKPAARALTTEKDVLSGPTPATKGAQAAKADDAARDARKGRKAPAKAAPAPKAPAKAPKAAPKAAKPAPKATELAPGNPALTFRANTPKAARYAPDGQSLPAAPDFSADTHKPYRAKLARLTALVKARDLAGLRAFGINPISTSPKAMDRYRNAAVAYLSGPGKAKPANGGKAKGKAGK